MTPDDRAWMYDPDRHCRGVSPSLMYPHGSRGTIAAVAICVPFDGEPCPCLLECRQYALDHREVYGVWGGLSQRQRERLLRGKGPRREPIVHGTMSGFSKHKRRHEPACEACKAAHARWREGHRNEQKVSV